MGRKYVTFVVHLLSFFAIECQKMKSTRLDMDPAYTSLQPSSSQYYITKLTGIHRMICFLLCIQHSDTCAGTLVKVDTRQCKLMSTHMNGLAMDGSKPGWSFWAVKNSKALVRFIDYVILRIFTDSEFLNNVFFIIE